MNRRAGSKPTALALVAVGWGASSAQVAAQHEPSFEVASVKENRSGDSGGIFGPGPSLGVSGQSGAHRKLRVGVVAFHAG